MVTFLEISSDKHWRHIYNRTMNTGKKGLGTDFKRLREKRGLSVAELADRSGLPRGSIYKIENENRMPQTDVALKLCHALGVELSSVTAGKIRLEPVQQPPATLADLERLLSSLTGLDTRDRRFVLQYATEAIRQNRKQQKKS